MSKPLTHEARTCFDAAQTRAGEIPDNGATSCIVEALEGIAHELASLTEELQIALSERRTS